VTSSCAPSTPCKPFQGFVDVIQKKMTGARGRKLEAEVIPEGLDFKSWFDKLNINVAGLVTTANEEFVPHSFRFVKRKA
jgi:hypothetical protein